MAEVCNKCGSDDVEVYPTFGGRVVSCNACGESETRMKTNG
jgi:uncharacterized Zn finger protein